MKKSALIGIVLLMIMLMANQALFGEEPGGSSLYAGFGTLTVDDFSFSPFLWFAGLNYDYHLGHRLMISPEFYIIAREFAFETAYLAPAVLVNVKINRLFAGAGISKYFRVGERFEDISSDISLKLNIGFRQRRLKIALFGIFNFDDIFADMAFGLTIGIKFTK